MRKITLLLAFFICLSCYSQTTKKWRGNYLLKGNIENTSIKDVTLYYTAETKRGVVSDTLNAAVADGKFSFSGYIEEPLFVTLRVNNNELNFFLDATTIEINIASDDNKFTIKGSSTSDDYLEIEELRKGFQLKNEKELSILDQKKDSLSNECGASIGETYTAVAQLESQADLAPLTFAAKNNASFAVLKAMNNFLDPRNKYYKKEVCTQMMYLYSQMPEHIKETPTGINVSGKLLMAKLNMQF